MYEKLIGLACKGNALLNSTRAADFLAPLALRLYLTPVFWTAGINKYNGFAGTAAWFGEGGLGLPLPSLMAALATATEIGGAVLLFFGIAVRWVSVPLMAVMLVAIFAVHLGNGWQAVADRSSPFAGENIEEAMTRLERARAILQENSNYSWLTEHGGFVVANNGIEWGATYFVMLLVLFFIGSGRASVDHLLVRRFSR
ncbi:MAG: DoxX family protein [Gammaproteobacteria bacterium]|nr:DoxX family protein [Gammaproteobacteria bacterium]